MYLTEPDEIAIYVQQEDWYKFAGIGIFLEPARFVEPKPYALSDVLDDTWAALILRVDPLARKILDPRRSYAGAFILLIIISTVFSSIRPTVRMTDLSSYDDNINDDFYMYIADDDFDQDDVFMAEMDYRKVELESEIKMWGIGYAITIFILFLSTGALAFLMEQRNIRYDLKIQDVCNEIGARFESAGITIEYRTHHELQHCRKYFVQERAIVFKGNNNARTIIKTAANTTATASSTMNMNSTYSVDSYEPNIIPDFSTSTSGELYGVPYLPHTSDEESY